MTGKERLEEYLRGQGVGFQSVRHPEVYTAQEVAAAQHISGNQLAKVVIVRADDEMAMLLLPASYRVDFGKLKVFLGVRKAWLAKEEEFGDVFPDCEIGAMPPFGNLYELSVYVDSTLAEVSEMLFKVGTHRDSMKIRYSDFERLAGPKVGDFSVHL